MTRAGIVTIRVDDKGNISVNAKGPLSKAECILGMELLKLTLLKPGSTNPQGLPATFSVDQLNRDLGR